MIEIRVVGENYEEVSAWVKIVQAMAQEEPSVLAVEPSHVRPGRKGDFLAYINVRTPGQPVAVPRVARKSTALLGRRWRRRRSRS